MGFRDLEKEFKERVNADRLMEEPTFRYWQLRLLFEIAGNLDSLVVSNRNAEKHIEKMATAYSDLVAFQRGKAGGQK